MPHIARLLAQAMAKMHALFATGPLSTTLFFFYFVNPPAWGWTGLAVVASGGYNACLSGDFICRHTSKVLMFGATYQYEGIPHIELAFTVFMLLWIASTFGAMAVLLWK